MQKDFIVYILASPSRSIYIGVTSNLEQRIWQHKTKTFEGHTAKYGIDRLVFWEEQFGSDNAFAREKQLKGWSRAKKLQLIDDFNPRWHDLSYALFGWSSSRFRRQVE